MKKLLILLAAFFVSTAGAQGVGGSSGFANYSNPFANVLTHWFSGGISGKTIVIAGDSTVSNAVDLFTFFSQNETGTGQPLAGVTILNYGENGASLAAFLADIVTHGITNTIAASANLYILCYGINDVRLGTTDQAALETLIVSAVAQIRAARPGSDIVLWGPNSLLTTDVGGNNWVQPNSAAQAYTDILYNAYGHMVGRWPNVGVVQKQDGVFTRISPATSIYMTDQLHPNTLGQMSEGAQLIPYIGYGP